MSNKEDQFDDAIEYELEEVAESKEEESTEDTGFKMPEKFNGKSAEEIAKAYTELESAHGRQANEYGELRKMTDKYLFENLANQNTPKSEEQPEETSALTFDDIVEDPNTAVGKLVSSQLKGVTEKLDSFEKKERLREFQSQFPEYQNDIADEAFQSWVKGSKYRSNLFVKANNYDTEAGTELWSEWQERKALHKQQVQEALEEKETQQEESLKKATGESSSTGARTRKVYRRADIVRLKAQDPEKYWSMAEEFNRARKEGRVK